MKEDKNIIKDISKAIGKDLNQVDIITDTTFGLNYKFTDEKITELGLDLSKLNLDENKLTLVGEYVQKLQNLKSFYIKVPKNNDLPDWLMQLTNLEQLCLRRNNLQSIPEGIRNFTSLKSLNMVYNNIIELPDWLLNLSELNEFYLDKNDFLDWNQKNLNILRALHDRGGKISAPRLFRFQLKYNLPSKQIEIIRELEKDNIEKERKKQYVNPINITVENKKIVNWKMHEYSFKTLPKNFGVFKDLESLIITNTPIEVLPESFGDLTNLKFLDLSNNKLNQLPESFVNLVLISKLNLSKNNFDQIPTQLWNFDELTELQLFDNPLNDEEKNIIQKIPDIIRDYLRKKATIKVFISHAVIDFEEYRIEQLVEFLNNQKEISEAYFCEADLAGNID
ncbi:MAG: leucine-rich repeat domain-containing protein, partial [Promethearchaeota archaeon]